MEEIVIHAAREARFGSRAKYELRWKGASRSPSLEVSGRSLAALEEKARKALARRKGWDASRAATVEIRFVLDELRETARAAVERHHQAQEALRAAKVAAEEARRDAVRALLTNMALLGVRDVAYVLRVAVTVVQSIARGSDETRWPKRSRAQMWERRDVVDRQKFEEQKKVLLRRISR